MRLKPSLFLVACLATASQGCYVETLTDRAPTIGDGTRDKKSDDSNDAGVCRHNISRGCFDGHVLSKTEFFVEGKSFFNAGDLAARFRDLLKVEGDATALTADEYSLTWTTVLDNQTFAQQFEYYFRGERTGAGKVRANGNFSVNDLPEGSYDLRVQRPIKFALSRAAAAPVNKPDNDPDSDEPGRDDDVAPPTVQVTKLFCATLYADATMDVRRAKRITETFSDFRLHVMDANCEGAATTTLSLNR